MRETRGAERIVGGADRDGEEGTGLSDELPVGAKAQESAGAASQPSSGDSWLT